MAKIRAGLVDVRDLVRRGREARPIAEHIEAWSASLVAKGLTAKHVGMAYVRVRRLVAIVRGAALGDIAPERSATRADLTRLEAELSARVVPARLADLSADAVQGALRALIDEGLSLQSANHYRAAVKAFSKWAWKSGRMAFDPLVSVAGYNVKEDPRHDRRAVRLDELQRLVRVAHEGPEYMDMTGPCRTLAYRLACATGLRYSEINSITPESCDWTASPATVAAAYTKNGEPATLPLTGDLADDLRPHMTSTAPGAAVFPLPNGKGAALLRFDLSRAGIPYVDASGRFFDFHSLRAMLATTADAAGVSSRNSCGS